MTDSGPITITYVLCQPQLCLYRHVAHYFEANPAHQVVSVRDNHEWRRLKEHAQCPQLSESVDLAKRYYV